MFWGSFRQKEAINTWILKGDVHFTHVLEFQAGGVIVNSIALIPRVMERSNIAESSTSSNDISWKGVG